MHKRKHPGMNIGKCNGEPVGYCHSSKHTGYITVSTLKQHQCLEKGCSRFEKYKDAFYWNQIDGKKVRTTFLKKITEDLEENFKKYGMTSADKGYLIRRQKRLSTWDELDSYFIDLFIKYKIEYYREFRRVWANWKRDNGRTLTEKDLIHVEIGGRRKLLLKGNKLIEVERDSSQEQMEWLYRTESEYYKLYDFMWRIQDWG